MYADTLNRGLHPLKAAYVRTTTVNRRYLEIAALSTMLLLAAMLRLYDLSVKSFWLDEGFSVFVGRESVRQLIDTIVNHDTAPPLYFLLLHFWIVSRADPWTVRLLSTVMGIASVGVMYLLGRDVAGRRTGLLAALLLTVSPFQVWYSQEARMYSLLALLCLLSTLFLLRGLTRNQSTWWVAYTISTALALYTQMSAVFFVLSAQLAAIAFLAFTRPQAGAPVPLDSTSRGIARLTSIARPYVLSHAAIAVLWLPWLPSFLHQAANYGVFWIPTSTPDNFKTLLFDLTSVYFPHWRIPQGMAIIIGAAVVLALLGARSLTRRDFAFLLALVVAPVVMMYLISLFKPIFLSRALIYVSAPYLLLIACGISSLRVRGVGSVLLGGLLVINVVSLYRIYKVIPKEEWNLAAGYVEARAAPGDLVLMISAATQFPFDYYAKQQPKPLEEHELPVDVLSTGPLEPAFTAASEPRMDQLVGQRASFWLVESHTEFADPEDLALHHAMSTYRLLDTVQFEGIKVFHFARSTAGVPGG